MAASRMTSDARILTKLLEAADDPSIEAWASAAHEDPKRWLPPLIEVLRRGNLGKRHDQRGTWDLLVGVASEMARRAPDDAITLLHEIVDSDPLLVAQVAFGLDDPRSRPLLAALVANQSAEVRWVAVSGLGCHGGPDVTALLLSRLRDRARIVRSAAIAALARHGDEAAAGALAAFARKHRDMDPDAAARAMAVSRDLAGGDGSQRVGGAD